VRSGTPLAGNPQDLHIRDAGLDRHLDRLTVEIDEPCCTVVCFFHSEHRLRLEVLSLDCSAPSSAPSSADLSEQHLKKIAGVLLTVRRIRFFAALPVGLSAVVARVLGPVKSSRLRPAFS